MSPERVLGAFPTMPGLYVHVPFCRTICPFCPYNKVLFSAGAAADYLEALRGEASMYLAAYGGGFSSLYVGGGTPTLCLDGLAPLLEDLPIGGERAIEVMPGHMTEATAGRLRDLGFDSVSLGVQSFDGEVLRRLRRPGSSQQHRRAVVTARETFSCVDVDLIFDTAFDRPDVLADDLKVCFESGVDQVSTYPLIRFGYTPFGRARVSRAREHAALQAAGEVAKRFGYERRAVWTFHHPGSRPYTSITRPYYLGLGAGAATFAGRVFAVNHFGLDRYAEAVADGRLPIARTARLPVAAAAAYRVFWQAYTGRIPLEPDDPLLRHPVATAVRDVSYLGGWSRRSGSDVVLTRAGYEAYHDLERWITRHLIEPLWAEMMKEHDDDGHPPGAVG